MLAAPGSAIKTGRNKTISLGNGLSGCLDTRRAGADSP